MTKDTVRQSVFIVLALLVSLSLWGLAAAQDNETSARPFLGIRLSPSDEGVEVTGVTADSPAAEAGLRVGDIIQSINDEAVTADTIREVINGYAVGDEITLHIQRDDESLTLTAALAARPVREVPQGLQLPERPMLGVRLEDTDAGVVIREVVADSPAEEAGLQTGDTIIKIGDQEISSAQEASAAIQAMQVGDGVTLEVNRDNETLTIEATLGSTPLPQIQQMPFGRDFPGFGFAYNGNDQTWTIRRLSEESALYAAGLREGDVIQQFDNNTYDPAGLREYLNTLEADADVSVTVDRDGETQDIAVPVSALNEISGFGFGNNEFHFFGPDGQSFNIPFNMGQLFGGGWLGVQYITLDDAVAEEWGVSQTVGALVTQVADDSPAADAGVQVDDIITAVNDEPVNEEHSLRDRLVAYEPGDTITLNVQRGEETLELEVTLGEAQMSDMMPFFGDRDFRFFGPDGQGFPFEFEFPRPQTVPPQSNL